LIKIRTLQRLHHKMIDLCIPMSKNPNLKHKILVCRKTLFCKKNQSNLPVAKFSSFALPVSLYAPTSGRAPALIFKSDWGRVWERRTWDIRSISNVTCKNWRENLLLFSTGKPRLRRKNPTVKFGALAGYPSPSLPTFLSYFRAFFDPSRASLFSTP
jgi:hypothetical protein